MIEVAFDLEKPQVKEYIRVYVKFDVSKPLRRGRKVMIPGGEEVNILYDYERIQKRCYTCQCLTHEQPQCPFFKKVHIVPEKLIVASTERIPPLRMKTMDESDPLFGVISEDQLGLDPLSGKPKIGKEVLEGMRMYLNVSAGVRVLQSGKVVTAPPDLNEYSGSTQSGLLMEGSMGYSASFFKTNASGTTLKKPKSRRRPGTYTRKANGKHAL